MKRNRTLGKFMKRNELPICLYAGIMGLLLIGPLFWEKLLYLQLAGIAVCTTIFIGYLNYQYSHDRLFKDLFKEFNERYDKFNDQYDDLRDQYSEGDLIEAVSREHTRTIIDYLNLCAEEFFWFEKGRIDENAWKSWEAGMKTWAELPVLRTVFTHEVATWKSSYYKNFVEFYKGLIELPA